MPRKKRQTMDLGRKANRPTKREDRFAFSEDGVYVNDGLFRWWKEWDDSGYGWSGQFDIINREQLKHRVDAARTVGMPVYHKEPYGAGEEHEQYTPVEHMAEFQWLFEGFK